MDSIWLVTELERKNLESRPAYDETTAGWARALDRHDREPKGCTRAGERCTVDVPGAVLLKASRLTTRSEAAAATHWVFLGTAVPILVRVLTVVDVYDALNSGCLYRQFLKA